MVILTNGNVKEAPEKKSGKSLERKSYIAIFRVDHVQADSDGLRFDLVERLHDLR